MSPYWLARSSKFSIRVSKLMPNLEESDIAVGVWLSSNQEKSQKRTASEAGRSKVASLNLRLFFEFSLDFSLEEGSHLVDGWTGPAVAGPGFSILPVFGY